MPYTLDTAPWLILLAAGQGTRLAAAAGCPKQFLTVDSVPLFWLSVRTCSRVARLGGVVFVFPKDTFESSRDLVRELDRLEPCGLNMAFAVGGARRQDSVASGLAVVPQSARFVLVHDAARPFFSPGLVNALLDRLEAGAQAVIPGLAVTDTIKVVNKAGLVCATPDRSTLRAVQTPQGFSRRALAEAHRTLNTPENTVTDDASLMEEAGHEVLVIDGEAGNIKITNPEDLQLLKKKAETGAEDGSSCTKQAAPDQTVPGQAVSGQAGENGSPAAPDNPDTTGCLVPCTGFGYDVHRYGGDRPLVLAGVPIPCDFQVRAHSDGDVLLHALMDALLGLFGQGDIGMLFPDNDPRYDGADSAQLLAEVLQRMRQARVRLTHADVTVVAQKPRLSPHKKAMQESLCRLLGLGPEHVNVKATTEEGLGFTGDLSGIKAYATVCGLKSETI
ncbi:MAG TPA: 2-C-methyl-D-erythritol 4-phosphate cytidylyltransferase [Candidatus Desulfovibrio intestinipullorum]|uniref:Bifunctional enzyme IspD/IspF n=1 Tax=Candidatus Desulfovibrio intestinipullorum TaxID=2838536 RepID=A0A9D1PUB0_9BACT|nr:2-C-methyl-D-erythritol 4-phosphate cytidylyltransferase [Candidatus Desulfovibrio intestinipullorum]